MDVDIKGRIKNLNLPKNKGLLPMFEAVVNSIHAFNNIISDESKIEIKIERDTSQTDLTDSHYIPPVQSFEIVDNASGFNDINFHSFSTSDSTLKAELGGKGVGRFIWLKAYDSVRIDSIYLQDKKYHERHFDFLLTQKAIENLEEGLSEKSVPETRLRLQNLKAKYQQFLPKNADLIAQRLLEHCLSFFISSRLPQIYVIDNNGDSYNINSIYNNEIKEYVAKHDFKVNNLDFKLDLIKYRTTSDQVHFISYCAHSREVKRENLATYIPLLTTRLKENGKDFIYLCYISSQYLDESVNQERTSFSFEESSDEEVDGQGKFVFKEEATIKQIREEVLKIVKPDSEAYVQEIRQEHVMRVQKFIKEQCPEYRHILKYNKADIDDISPNSSDATLDSELHKISYRIDSNIRENSRKILENDPKEEKEIQEYNIKYEALLDQLTDSGISNLAKYVTHRKVLISLFEQRLKLDTEDKYYLEKSIHELFVPMKKDSNQVEFLKQNLWMIDERLSYHYYLSSDLPFSDMETTDSVSEDRPDIMIFNKSIAYVETEQPFNSIVIIEFKRPERTAYPDDENPITQVYSYMSQIEENKVKTSEGRTVMYKQGTPFYAYIICDINEKIKRFAKDGVLQPTPDQLGYFGFNTPRNAYIEIISYDKLLLDAKKRNKVLFDRLGLPPTIITNKEI
jgi:hypothetical protein